MSRKSRKARRAARRRKPDPVRTFPAESYRRSEVLALLDACGSSATGKRNRALITVLWRGGLRLGEALDLQWRDIDFDAQAVRILHGKGDKMRMTALDPRALEILRQWEEEWEEKISAPRAPVFCTLKGRPLAQAYVRAMLPRLAKKAGVDRRIHAHGFRHTFAVELSRAGVPVREIQQLLGHSSLATTSVYLSSLSPEEAMDKVRNREW